MNKETSNGTLPTIIACYEEAKIECSKTQENVTLEDVSELLFCWSTGHCEFSFCRKKLSHELFGTTNESSNDKHVNDSVNMNQSVFWYNNRLDLAEICRTLPGLNQKKYTKKHLLEALKIKTITKKEIAEIEYEIKKIDVEVLNDVVVSGETKTTSGETSTKTDEKLDALLDDFFEADDDDDEDTSQKSSVSTLSSIISLKATLDRILESLDKMYVHSATERYEAAIKIQKCVVLFLRTKRMKNQEQND